MGKGAVESVVLADQGSDINVIAPSILKQLKTAVPGLEIQHLEPPHLVTLLDKGSGMSCGNRLAADVQLRIRHGQKLLLRQLDRHISDTEADYIVIGHHVLQAICCANRALLATACDKNQGVINVPQALASDTAARAAKGTIAALPGDGVFHSDEGGELDALEESNVYIDIGEDPESKRDEALEASVQKAGKNGLSVKAKAELRRIISKNRQIFD